MANKAPELTTEERAAALAKAAAARIERAALKDDLKTGKVSVADVLAMDSDIARRMKVKDLISSIPGYGDAKTEKLMEQIGISESRRVQGLGARQREELLAILG